MKIIQGREVASEDHHLNLVLLHYKANVLRSHYGEPLLVPQLGGYRTPEDQTAIYKRKKLPPKMGSYHLIGAALDISDPHQVLQRWILDHLELMEVHDLYFESFDATKTWVHFQVFPPASRKRFFDP
jgi:hypothetical protein